MLSDFRGDCVSKMIFYSRVQVQIHKKPSSLSNISLMDRLVVRWKIEHEFHETCGRLKRRLARIGSYVLGEHLHVLVTSSNQSIVNPRPFVSHNK